MKPMTRQERLLRLARFRGDRVAELIVSGETPEPAYRTVATGFGTGRRPTATKDRSDLRSWTEAELRAAWGDR